MAVQAPSKPEHKMKNNPDSRWIALVRDQIVPMPRRHVSSVLIREQANVPHDSVLVRDRLSGDDEVLGDDVPIDLADGNVFRLVTRCEPTKPGNLGDPKLAFVVDDKFEIATKPTQTDAGLKRLFNLDPRVELLRDMESPNDTPIAAGETVRFADGPVFLTCITVESHCKGTEGPPNARRYIIRVGDKRIVVDKPDPKGREILVLAGFDPSKTLLNQRIGRQFVAVTLDQKVDLTACGVERFTTLPNEQGEGRPGHEFALPEEDVETLDANKLDWQALKENGVNWLIIRNIPLPGVFLNEPTDVAIQVPAGYPSTSLDMAFFNPPIRRRDGKAINCTNGSATLRGKTWQQWSRHYSAENPWKPGEYSVYTHYLLSLAWLDREASKA